MQTENTSEKKIKVPVLEVFGPTIQGEGAVCGQKTIFVRTAGCDYKCSWCDSAFTWDGSEKPEMLTTKEVLSQILDLSGAQTEEWKSTGNLNCDHVTISGGNPALLKNLGELVYSLRVLGFGVATETQGTRYQDWFQELTELTLSPKPPSSGMTTNYDLLDNIVNEMKPNTNVITSLKVVIFDEKDFEYAKGIHKRYPHLPMFLQVGNIHVKDAPTNHKLLLLEQYSTLVDWVIADPEMNKVRPLPQMHTLIWGNDRGV